MKKNKKKFVITEIGTKNTPWINKYVITEIETKNTPWILTEVPTKRIRKSNKKQLSDAITETKIKCLEKIGAYIANTLSVVLKRWNRRLKE